MGKRTERLVNRLLMGKEKSEDFARASLPSNRWELFWDILKGSFWKLVLLNLLVLLFCLPLVLLVYYRGAVGKNYATIYPFAQGFGVGYQAPYTMQGFLESISYNANMVVYLALPIVMFIAAIGISGGAYTIRNMVWSEGVFVSNDFWKGIKQNYKQILLILLIFSLIFYLTILSSSLARYNIAGGASIVWIYYVLEILSYVILGYYSLMTLHMITLSVTYELTTWQVIRNSFYVTLAFFPLSLFFGVVALIPFGLLFVSEQIPLLTLILVVVLLLMGFSYTLLVWTNYSQWTFDKFINDMVPGAKKNRGIYEKYKAPSTEKTLSQYKAISRNSLNSRPIKPITDEEITLVELPQSFSREDLERLKASKTAMYEDNKKYIEEHKDDERYQPTEEELKAQKELKARAKKVEQAKKILKRHEKYKK